MKRTIIILGLVLILPMLILLTFMISQFATAGDYTGQNYPYTDKRMSRTAVGDTIDLHYVPDKPTRVRTAADYRVTSNPALLVLIVPVMLAMILGVVWLIRDNLKKLK